MKSAFKPIYFSERILILLFSKTIIILFISKTKLLFCSSILVPPLWLLPSSAGGPILIFMTLVNCHVAQTLLFLWSSNLSFITCLDSPLFIYGPLIYHLSRALFCFLTPRSKILHCMINGLFSSAFIYLHHCKSTKDRDDN